MTIDKKILQEPQVQAAFNGVAIPKVIEPMIDALNGITPPTAQPAIQDLSETVPVLTINGLSVLGNSMADTNKIVNKILDVLRNNGVISA